jgi:ornithine carbamoyltransferase
MTREAKPIPGHMQGRDWLMTQDWSDEEIELALDTADNLKDEVACRHYTFRTRAHS